MELVPGRWADLGGQTTSRALSAPQAVPSGGGVGGGRIPALSPGSRKRVPHVCLDGHVTCAQTVTAGAGVPSGADAGVLNANRRRSAVGAVREQRGAWAAGPWESPKPPPREALCRCGWRGGGVSGHGVES